VGPQWHLVRIIEIGISLGHNISGMGARCGDTTEERLIASCLLAQPLFRLPTKPDFIKVVPICRGNPGKRITFRDIVPPDHIPQYGWLRLLSEISPRHNVLEAPAAHLRFWPHMPFAKMGGTISSISK